jgi:hypothetical protein
VHFFGLRILIWFSWRFKDFNILDFTNERKVKKSYPCTVHEDFESVAVWLHIFKTSAGTKWTWVLTLRLGYFTHGERGPGACWIGGYVSRSERFGGGKISRPCRESNDDSSLLHFIGCLLDWLRYNGSLCTNVSVETPWLNSAIQITDEFPFLGPNVNNLFQKSLNYSLFWAGLIQLKIKHYLIRLVCNIFPSMSRFSEQSFPWSSPKKFWMHFFTCARACVRA